MNGLRNSNVLDDLAINVVRYREDLADLSEAERSRIVWNGDEILLIFGPYNYVSGEFRFSFRRAGGWSFQYLIRTICSKYREMYREEERVCGPSQTIPRTGNRMPTDGPYGFTHHFLHDLQIETVYISYGGIVTFDVSS